MIMAIVDPIFLINKKNKTKKNRNSTLYLSKHPQITQINLHKSFTNLPSTFQILQTQADVMYGSTYAIDKNGSRCFYGCIHRLSIVLQRWRC
jgi:hypothetical protein